MRSLRFGSPWRTRLRWRLQLPMTVTTVVLVVVLGVLAARAGYLSVRRQAAQGNRQLATLAAKGIAAQYDAIWSGLSILASGIEREEATCDEQVRDMIDLRLSAPLTYRALYLFDSHEQLCFHLADPVSALYDLSPAQVIARPAIEPPPQVVAAHAEARKGSPYRSAVQIDLVDLVPILYLGIPITQRNQPAALVLVAEIDLRDIWRGVDQIYAGETGRAYVVSPSGIIIAHPDRRYVGERLSPELRSVLEGYAGQTEYVDPISGRTMLAAYRPVSRQSGWGIVVEQEYAEAFAAANQIAWLTGILLLAAIALVTLITSLVARTITEPIQELASTTRAIADTGYLNHDVVVSGEDEIAHLAATFNQMIASLREARTSLEAYSARLESMVEERTRELQEAQEQLVRQERLAMLGQLAGGVAHELRNPLGVIANAVYLLQMRSGDADEATREYLDIVADQVRNSSKIVSDLLDFTRARSADRERVSVDDLVRQALAQCEVPSTVKLELDIPDDAPRAYVDPVQIERVLNNLITNACQAMPEGGTLTVGAAHAADGSDEILLWVSDTGVGIPAEHMERLFEPLFTTKTRGIGLGLAISKKLVESNEGRIDVESQEGVGTTFRLWFPTVGANPV